MKVKHLKCSNSIWYLALDELPKIKFENLKSGSMRAFLRRINLVVKKHAQKTGIIHLFLYQLSLI